MIQCVYSVHDQHSAISEKMHRMSVNHHNRFEMLQQAFNVSEEQQKIVKEEVETRILKLAENFNAEISITGKSNITLSSAIVPFLCCPCIYHPFFSSHCSRSSYTNQYE